MNHFLVFVCRVSKAVVTDYSEKIEAIASKLTATVVRTLELEVNLTTFFLFFAVFIVFN